MSDFTTDDTCFQVTSRRPYLFSLTKKCRRATDKCSRNSILSLCKSDLKEKCCLTLREIIFPHNNFCSARLMTLLNLNHSNGQLSQLYVYLGNIALLLLFLMLIILIVLVFGSMGSGGIDFIGRFLGNGISGSEKGHNGT